MNQKTRQFCPQCKTAIKLKIEEDRERDYCPECDRIFYDNPLPVVSAVIVNDNREVLLVLRDREPHEGIWCLPSGFVELKETIQEAVIRETKEETGVAGRVVRLLDSQSYYDEFYGDLIWVTFEVEHVSGKIKAGDDAREVGFFPITDLPELAFSSNTKAINRYLDLHRDLWKMQDSYLAFEGGDATSTGGMLSDSLFDIIIRDADIITLNWVSEVTTHPTTKSYAMDAHDKVYDKGLKVVVKFASWISHPRDEQKDIWKYFKKIGKKRFKHGYRLPEVVSALSLVRKHIFAHVLAEWQTWKNPLEIYTSMEFMTRVNLFFDRANYQITKGFEKAIIKAGKNKDNIIPGEEQN